MKTLLFLSAFFILPVSLLAQEKIPREKQKPERVNQFEISPKFKSRQSDSLIFSDTFPGLPDFSFIPELVIPDHDTNDPFRMPVVIVQPEFSFNMPVMVPDSSVHYYIKQAIPVSPLPMNGRK